ncbi:hypothetical protein O6H91_11G002400 [Diphasiastrum complanatum]|uniref:Uncharacterized protein n=1 Tax=Diphasiastrum complanatum TaxID=34168 RepID=A0ACC2C5P0_DIPCM|nr:hypothetical protein O6H91_11G002400 [Diphasiastrum complanatum]
MMRGSNRDVIINCLLNIEIAYGRRSRLKACIFTRAGSCGSLLFWAPFHLLQFNFGMHGHARYLWLLTNTNFFVRHSESQMFIFTSCISILKFL